MISKLLSKDFYKKPTWEKRENLENFLLNFSDIKIGDEVLCYEDREMSTDTPNNMYFSRFSTPEKLKSFKVGKTYKILDKKHGTIKIKGDKDKLLWTTTKRFLGRKALRHIKLKELKRKEKLKTNLLTE